MPRIIRGTQPDHYPPSKATSTSKPVDEIGATDKENRQNSLNMKGNNHVKKHKVTGFIGCVPVVTTEIPDPPSDEEEEEVESPCEVHEEREEDSNPMVVRGSQFISNDPCDFPIETFQIDVKLKNRILNAPRYNRVQSKSVKTSYHVYLTKADRILPLKEHLDILVKLLYSLQAKKLRVLNVKSEVQSIIFFISIKLSNNCFLLGSGALCYTG